MNEFKNPSLFFMVASWLFIKQMINILDHGGCLHEKGRSPFSCLLQLTEPPETLFLVVSKSSGTAWRQIKSLQQEESSTHSSASVNTPL